MSRAGAVVITRRESPAIQSLLDYLNQHIEAMVECHSIPGQPLSLDQVDRYRLSRDIRIRRRSEHLLIGLDAAMALADCLEASNDLELKGETAKNRAL